MRFFQASINYGNTDRVTKATLYNQAVSYHPLKILCDSSFSSSDTLYIGAKGGDYIDTFLVGPFYDNQIFENITLYTPFISNGYTSTDAHQEIKADIWWGLGYSQFDSISTNAVGWDSHISKVNQRVCQQGDTVYVDLKLVQ